MYEITSYLYVYLHLISFFFSVSGIRNITLFLQHAYSCETFTPGFSINTKLLDWSRLALWGREVLEKGMGVKCGFWW